MTPIVPFRRLTTDETTVSGARESRRIEGSLRDLTDFAPQPATVEPSKGREGMIRLAKAPWDPTGLGAGWVYFNGTAWVPIQGAGGASAISFTPVGTLGATNVQAAIVEASNEALTAAAAANTNANTRFLASGISAYGATLVDDLTAAAARTTLGSGFVGDQVFVAASGGVALSAMGASAVGISGLVAVDAAAGRNAITAPARPTATVAALGQWVRIAPGVGLIATLPAGGTWSYQITLYSNATAVYVADTAGVLAGGATAGSASVGNFWVGFAWRVA